MSARPGTRRWLRLFAGLALSASACGGGSGGGTSIDEAGSGATVATTPAADRSATSPAEPGCQPAPLELRAATVLVVGIGDGTTVDDPLASEVAGLGVGGVTLRPPNIVGAGQVRALIDGLRQRSPGQLLVGVDEEGGRVSRLRPILGDTDSARVLGQRPPAEIEDTAAERAAVMRDLGFDVTFAPVVDADGGPADGAIGDRSFAAAPDQAGALASSFAAGLGEAQMVAVAKHFPGQGGLEDSHDGSVVSDAALAEVEATAAGFAPLVDAEVPAVMMSHVTFSALGPLPASLEPAAYSLLRSQGFDGVAITDSLGMGAIVQRWPTPEATVMALAAGADMVLANQGDQATAMRDAVVAAVTEGRLSEARLDEAVARVRTLLGDEPATMACD